MTSSFNQLDPSIKSRIHEFPPDEVYKLLDSAPEGLSTAEAARRLDAFGRNLLKEVKGKPLYIKLLANFTHLMAILLWVSGIVAFIARMPQLGIAVWMVNIINGAFSFWQEFRAEKATEALKKILPTTSRVMRNGEEILTPAEELIPGDVIFLMEGDSIPADCRVLNSTELRVNQSTLTGESRPVNRSAEPVLVDGLNTSEIPNLIFAGTFVAAGSAKAIVYATGMQTSFGRIAQLTQEVGEDLSPLQKEMKSITKVVTLISVLVGVVFFIIAILLADVTPAEGFIFALGMVVAFVPEGLLPTVTLALAMGTQRMAKRNALIKKLSAVETLGCTNVICTDKTGTLTQNEMTVKHLWLPAIKNDTLGDRYIDLGGSGYKPEGKIEEDHKEIKLAGNHALSQLLITGGRCNNARLLAPDAQNPDEKDRWKILGDPTEAALIVAAFKAGLQPDDLNSSQIVAEMPFDSSRKRMSRVHLQRAGDTLTRIAYVKGGPKEVLECSNHILIGDEIHPLNDSWRKNIVDANDGFARKGLRVLAMAQKQLDQDFNEYNIETIESNLVFIGLVAMMDPPRPEVLDAVSKCHQAGIRIVMITGDYGLTAESIAKQIGIVQKQEPRIISGYELDHMDDASLTEAVKQEVIFARVAPEHKLRVVSALQAQGNIVAVTGDGVNDAPALKKADIGVAMGITGSDVAKEAADMILTDDNFASIVNAIEEGRAVYQNIKRFTTYIFTSNTPEAVPFILFAFSGARIPLALNVMHVLAVDLGTDIVPALALGAEPPEPGLMDLPPRRLSDHIITPALLIRAYLVLGPVQAAASMLAFYFFFWTNGYAGQWIDLPGEGWIYHAATAMALCAVVTTQIGNLFAQRTTRNSIFKTRLAKNPLIWIGILSELLVAAVIVYLPFMQRFIGTAAFPLKYWLFLFALIPILLLVDELYKLVMRQKEKRAQKRIELE
jgi:magnesium-transporting ATPase (P-type)